MKRTNLTIAIAAAALASTSLVYADGHASNTIKTALADSTLTGQVYGGYQNNENEFVSGTPAAVTTSEGSDFGLEEARLGLISQVKDNVELGIEMIWNAGAGPGQNSQTVINDLYLKKDYGNTSVYVGRFKQVADRRSAVERSDAIFTGLNLDTGFGGISFATTTLGPRRADGVQVSSFNDAGFHGSAAIIKAGVDTENDANNNSDSTRKFGYSLTGGWIGGDDNLQFGVTLGYAQNDGDEDSDSGADTSSESDSSGYSIQTILATGPFVGGLNYNDGETESESRNGTTRSTEDNDADGYNLWGAFNLLNAERSFDQYGVLQGPNLSKGEIGYEVGLSYGSGDSATEENDGLGTPTSFTKSESELDAWSLAFNVYTGENCKWFFQYSQVESEQGGNSLDLESTSFTLGGRLSF